MDLSQRTPSDDPPPRPSSDDVAADDVAIVRDSYARIGPRGAALTVTFFARLTERVPRVRRFFPPDDKEKRVLAKDLFDLVVGHLESQLNVRWVLERMGRRGLLDTIAPSDVSAVGGCLLDALAELDESWSPATARAWSRVYDWAATAVVRGAELRRTIR